MARRGVDDPAVTPTRPPKAGRRRAGRGSTVALRGAADPSMTQPTRPRSRDQRPPPRPPPAAQRASARRRLVRSAPRTRDRSLSPRPPPARHRRLLSRDLRMHERHLHEQLLAPHAEPVEGPYPHQVDDDLDAHQRAPTEVGQRAVRPAAFRRPFAHDGRDGRLAHLLDVGQPDSQCPAVALDGEVAHAASTSTGSTSSPQRRASFSTTRGE